MWIWFILSSIRKNSQIPEINTMMLFPCCQQFLKNSVSIFFSFFKFKSPETIDKVVFADILNPTTNPKLYDIVTSCLTVCVKVNQQANNRLCHLLFPFVWIWTKPYVPERKRKGFRKG